MKREVENNQTDWQKTISYSHFPSIHFGFSWQGSNQDRSHLVQVDLHVVEQWKLRRKLIPVGVHFWRMCAVETSHSRLLEVDCCWLIRGEEHLLVQVYRPHNTGKSKKSFSIIKPHTYLYGSLPSLKHTDSKCILTEDCIREGDSKISTL